MSTAGYCCYQALELLASDNKGWQPTASFCSALHNSPLLSRGCSGATTMWVTPNSVSGRVVKEVIVVVGAVPGGVLPPQRSPKVMSAPWE